jgi:hypothetical protein
MLSKGWRAMNAMRTRLMLGLALLLSGCGSSLAPSDLLMEDAVIRWGTSFGMCGGYCLEEIEIDGLVVRFTRRGWVPSQLPVQTEERTISEAERRDLLRNIAAAGIDGLNEVYGCPDCADGGAEWIELDNARLRKRVTFEFSRGPDQLQPALADLRALRGQFPLGR